MCKNDKSHGDDCGCDSIGWWSKSQEKAVGASIITLFTVIAIVNIIWFGYGVSDYMNKVSSLSIGDVILYGAATEAMIVWLVGVLFAGIPVGVAALKRRKFLKHESDSKVFQQMFVLGLIYAIILLFWPYVIFSLVNASGSAILLAVAAVVAVLGVGLRSGFCAVKQWAHVLFVTSVLLTIGLLFYSINRD